jgi:carbonic anhydrase/acetyltransferase-like protein (isoleucine patch superfamily)
MAIYELDGQAPEFPQAHYFVADTAVLIGNVRIEADVSIWFGAVLRGDIEPIVIGEGSNVQENSICHTDAGYPCIVGKNCVIGHNSIVHGCTIEDGVLIGMGAIVMNGSRVRKGCVVGAGAIITENKDFPEKSLIMGAPAKAVRTLTDEQIAELTSGAARYVANGKRFKAGLKKIG